MIIITANDNLKFGASEKYICIILSELTSRQSLHKS